MTREKAYDAAAAATQRGMARRPPPPPPPPPRRRRRGGGSAPTHSKVRRVVRFHAVDGRGKEGRAMAVKAVVGKASPDATVALRVAADAVPDSAKEYSVQATRKTLQRTFVQKNWVWDKFEFHTRITNINMVEITKYKLIHLNENQINYLSIPDKGTHVNVC